MIYILRALNGQDWYNSVMAVVRITRERQVPRVGLPDVSEEAKAHMRREITSMFSPSQFKRDVYYLKRTGKIAVQQIANQLGVDRRYVYRWMRADVCPRNPYPLTLVHLWAKALKEQIDLQDAEPDQPYYFSDR